MRDDRRGDLRGGLRQDPSSSRREPPRTVLELLRLSTDYLKGKGIDSARLDAEVLLGWVLGLERIQLYVRFDQPLTRAEVDAYREAIAARGRRVPLAYITGSREFFGLPIRVSPAVLIPRPETEVLVEQALALLAGAGAGEGPQAVEPPAVPPTTPQSEAPPFQVSSPASQVSGPLAEPCVAELGVGSGAVLVALARHGPPGRYFGTEVSAAALEVARANVEVHGVADRVTLLEGDLAEPLARLQQSGELRPLDLVVSNPPYIPTGRLEALAPEVRREPREALDGGPDGLHFYRRILAEVPDRLRDGGWLGLEVGDGGQAEAVVRMAQESGRFGRWRVQEDYAGTPRVVLLQRGRPA